MNCLGSREVETDDYHFRNAVVGFRTAGWVHKSYLYSHQHTADTRAAVDGHILHDANTVLCLRCQDYDIMSCGPLPPIVIDGFAYSSQGGLDMDVPHEVGQIQQVRHK